MSETRAGLTVLVVDDEQPQLEELRFLLSSHERVDRVLATDSAEEARSLLRQPDLDAAFLDIRMPGLTGLELAAALRDGDADPPAVVFVTAYEEHAVAAFEVDAVDYLLKPVRPSRLDEAVRRVLEQRAERRPAAVPAVAVELGGRTRLVRLSEIRYVEAQGDYARLHTAEGSHLLRTSLQTLGEEWADQGFVRIHRSVLVALPHVEEVRVEAGRCSVLVDGRELAVSRRHTRDLRDLLRARQP